MLVQAAQSKPLRSIPQTVQPNLPSPVQSSLIQANPWERPECGGHLRSGEQEGGHLASPREGKDKEDKEQTVARSRMASQAHSHFSLAKLVKAEARMVETQNGHRS